ncbi:MmpS family transport accessory protein [Actinoplanes sp. HUAS TT8]|uniref:MmpS family transport accessory protein n=1 Tax=Actinoplanes sp. HUAS TT8 TaxID=3447453 RepID=UPI003F524B90
MSDQRDPSRDYPPTSEFPPVGYAPPGYGPQGPYGPPPPPAPRRSNVPLIALILAVSLLLCGGVVTTGVLLVQRASDKAEKAAQKIPTALPTNVPTALPSDLPNVPGLSDGKPITVNYEVTGDGPATIIYTEKLGGLPKTVNDAKLPWKLSVTMDGVSFVSVSALRTSLEDGSISCKATINGATVSQHDASGLGATATCNKFTFN